MTVPVKVANAKSEVESNLKKTMQALDGKGQEAARLAKRKAGLVKRMRDRERRARARAAASKPRPKAKAPPPQKRACNPSPIKSCQFVRFVMVCP